MFSQWERIAIEALCPAIGWKLSIGGQWRGAESYQIETRFGIWATIGHNQPMSTPTPKPRDPLHGITLEKIVTQLVERHGFAEMGRRIPVRCFLFDPSVKSSLAFLRKTPWARAKVESWFIAELRRSSQNGNKGLAAEAQRPDKNIT